MADSAIPIRVAIVDDDGLVRDGLSAILELHADIRVISPGRRDSPVEVGLAPREGEILKLIAEGLSNKEIAAILNLSDGTIRNYVSDTLVKLELRDRTQLAIFYYRNIV